MVAVFEAAAHSEIIIAVDKGSEPGKSFWVLVHCGSDLSVTPVLLESQTYSFPA